MKFLHELAPDVPLNVRRIVGRIERINEVLAREAEPLCTEVESLHILGRLPSLFGDEGARELLVFVLQLSKLNQAAPNGEPLVSEQLIAQALAAEPIETSTTAEPVVKAGKTAKKPN